MSGSIGVESEYGSGATFFFSVSLQRGKGASTILESLSTSELQSKRALIIDENGSLSHAVQPYLDAAGLNTIV
ncbi:hypothetical protein ABTI05_19605, partial [Acinetobacter baumannii]